MKRSWRLASAVLASLVAACSAPTWHEPAPVPVTEWHKRYADLKCNMPFSIAQPQDGGAQLAFFTQCLNTKALPDPTSSEVVITIDFSDSEVRVVPARVRVSGGLHYDRAGNLIWFTNVAGDAAEAHHVDVLTLRKGESAPRVVGRLDVPFKPWTHWLVTGKECNAVGIARMQEQLDPQLEHRVLLFRDDDPVASAKVIDVGRVLYFDAQRNHFVAQRESMLLTHRFSDTLHRLALNCAGEEVPLEPAEVARLAQVKQQDATFMPSSRGDLLVNTKLRESTLTDLVLLFHGDEVTRIGPDYRPQRNCPDLSCALQSDMLMVSGWSPSGSHFALNRYGDQVVVYRAADLAPVRSWRIEPLGAPQVVLNDDAHAMQFADRSFVAIRDVPGEVLATPPPLKSP
jgi:hypothetical protein